MNFIEDCRRFGGKRAMTRLEHEWKVQDYKARQWQLAITGFAMLFFYVVFAHAFIACLIVLFFNTAAREAVRMRKLGRYWQTKRSIEVFNEPTWDGRNLE